MGFRSVIRTFVPSMKTIYLEKLTKSLEPCVATIGFFDGVHLGHRHIINKVVETARRENLLSTVVTFDRHPRQVLCPDWHPQLLSTLKEKTELLSQTGIDQLVVLSFDESMAALSAYDFMDKVLLQQLGVKILVTGYDNHFGHRQAGITEGFDDYVRYGHEMGMKVLQGDPFDAGAVRVSSSKVRNLLMEGRVELATECLGRPYILTGTVVSGEHIGTGMGYPTANLQLTDANKLIPAAGAYAVSVFTEGSFTPKFGMMNIGSRPTFGGTHQTLEVHILHFADNVYNQQLTVSFISRLRSEMKFESREALMNQLETDACQAEKILNQAQQL